MERVTSMFGIAGKANGSSPDPSKAYDSIRMDDVKDSHPLLDGQSELDDDDADVHPRAKLGPTKVDKPAISAFAFWFWIAVNCIATLVIVLVNKKILANPTLKGAPQLFVAYHFALTGLTLYCASLAGSFPLKRAPILGVLPLAAVFAAHTVVTNWSLALLEVAIYQELRIMVTPVTVLFNFLLYRKTISIKATIALTVVCTGIGITVYSDTIQKAAIKAAAEAAAEEGQRFALVRLLARAAADSPYKNGFLGYVAGMGGVALAALYTIWVGAFLPKFQLTPMQLLTWQAPLGSILLLVSVPFMDTVPVWANITPHEWTLLVVSGLCAVLLNVSQFFIVAGSSALSSSVVGHGKTCMVVAVGWFMATSAISLGSGVGIIMALVGIIAYAAVGLRETPPKK